MTLIVGISTRDTVLIAWDMRLSWNGVLRQEEFVKAAFFEASDARILYAYTGIAEWKTAKSSFNTVGWLSGAIYDCVKPLRSFEDVLGKLRDSAEAEFKSHPVLKALRPEDTRLSILFLGYVYSQTGKSFPVTATLSNFQNRSTGASYEAAQSKFFLHISTGLEVVTNPSLFLGAVNAVSQHRRNELNKMIAEGKPLEALKGKAQQIIEEAGTSSAAANSVGPNMMFATLQSDRKIPPATYHHSATGGDKIPLMGMTIPGAGIAIAKIELHVAEKFTGKQPPNAPCACGSGKKYKRCHGRPRHGK